MATNKEYVERLQDLFVLIGSNKVHMGQWWTDHRGDRGNLDWAWMDGREDVCGTAGCFAGWGAHLMGTRAARPERTHLGHLISDEIVAEHFGIPFDNETRESPAFSPCSEDWPEPMYNAYKQGVEKGFDIPTAEHYAVLTYIQHLIKEYSK